MSDASTAPEAQGNEKGNTPLGRATYWLGELASAGPSDDAETFRARVRDESLELLRDCRERGNYGEFERFAQGPLFEHNTGVGRQSPERSVPFDDLWTMFHMARSVDAVWFPGNYDNSDPEVLKRRHAVINMGYEVFRDDDLYRALETSVSAHNRRAMASGYITSIIPFREVREARESYLAKQIEEQALAAVPSGTAGVMAAAA